MSGNDYQEYEIACSKIRKANDKLLDEFEDWLFKAKLKREDRQ